MKFHLAEKIFSLIKRIKKEARKIKNSKTFLIVQVFYYRIKKTEHNFHYLHVRGWKTKGSWIRSATR